MKLSKEYTTQSLLHGDFHYYNILKADSKYKLIDPKGIIRIKYGVKIVNLLITRRLRTDHESHKRYIKQFANNNLEGIMYRENVQVYIYSLKDNRLLLLKRTEERSGYWQPVCGGIEVGESVISTGIREVSEETGITEWLEFLKIPNTYEYREMKNDVELEMKDFCTFMIINEIVDVKLSDEHVKYVWCELDEVKNYTDWEPITESIQWIKNNLKTREILPMTP